MYSALIASLESNTSGSKLEIKDELDHDKCVLIGNALAKNTTVTEVEMANVGIELTGALAICKALETNSTITKLDLGYNQIPPPGIVALGKALANNSSLVEVKIHRQAEDYGPSAEKELVELWKTNITLTRLYATLHDRTCNQVNTRGEVRNKEISKRKLAGKDFMDLDPARADEYKKQQEELRRLAAEEEAIKNAPISAKIESTGGPYTLKQLTCLKEYLPDDLDYSKKESFLADDEFQVVFGMEKEKFAALPKWKQNTVKKDKGLN